MRNLKDLAFEYIAAQEPEHKLAILEAAKLTAKNLEFQGYGKTLRAIGISYLAAINSSSKIAKGSKKDYNSLVLYLASGNVSGLEVCPFRSVGCSLACLMTSGRALMDKTSGRNAILTSRIVKTWLAMYNRQVFTELAAMEIEREQRKADKQGKGFCVRLNGTSDLIFSALWSRFPDVQFYDYTKNIKHAKGNQYANLHLTFSYSEVNLDACKQAYASGLNIAFPIVASDVQAVLAANPLAYDMDTTDLRFLDPTDMRFGILKVKTTDNTQAGIDYKFFLNAFQFSQIASAIQG